MTGNAQIDYRALLNRERARNRALHDRVALLEDQLFRPGLTIPSDWKLTPCEGRVFGALLQRDVVSRDAIVAAVATTEREPPQRSIATVYILKLRRKLTPFGVQIRTVHSVGYQLADRQGWKAHLAAMTAAP